jgi:EmrB/QacA subfamily drug resistance transporter
MADRLTTQYHAVGVVRRRLALAALLLGPFMGVLDVLIVTVAIPAIRGDLDATFGQTQLVVAGYATAYGVGLITGGRLGDRYGRRRLFLAGLTVFVAASAACGTAPDASLLITARMVQGFAAAAFVPQVLSIIRAWLPDEARPSAVGWYGTVVGVGAVSGPILGGLLVGLDVAGLGWRLVFLVNIPLGLLALAGVSRIVPESRGAAAVRLDLAGAALSAVGLAALLIPLIHSTEHGWSPPLLGMLGAAVLLLGGFITHQHRLERRGGAPLLPPRLFTRPRFAWGLVAVALLYVTDAKFFVLSYYMLDGLRLAPAWAGVLLAPVGIGFAIACAVVPRLFARFGLRVVAGGIALQALGCAAIAVFSIAAPARAHPPLLAVALLAAGVGHGLAVNPLFGLVVSSSANADAGAASGMLLTTTQVANALGVATVGSVFLALLGGTPHLASQASFAEALAWTMALLAVLAILAAPPLTRLRRPTPARTDSQDVNGQRVLERF